MELIGDEVIKKFKCCFFEKERDNKFSWTFQV